LLLRLHTRHQFLQNMKNDRSHDIMIDDRMDHMINKNRSHDLTLTLAMHSSLERVPTASAILIHLSVLLAGCKRRACSSNCTHTHTHTNIHTPTTDNTTKTKKVNCIRVVYVSQLPELKYRKDEKIQRQRPLLVLV